MIGRKLILMQNGQVFSKEEISFRAPFLEEWKHLTVKNIKKHSYVGLVAGIRFYIRFSSFLKNKFFAQ